MCPNVAPRSVHMAKKKVRGNVRKDLVGIACVLSPAIFLMSIYLLINRCNWTETVLNNAYHTRGLSGFQRMIRRKWNRPNYGDDKV